MNSWEEAIIRGGTAPDLLHAKLRVACMEEDVEKILRLVNVEGIPFNAFGDLAMIVSLYHDKNISIKTLESLSCAWFV